MNKGRDNDLYSRTQTDIYRGYDTMYFKSWEEDEKPEEEPEEEVQVKPVKKKKRRKKHYFLRFLVAIAFIAGIYAFLTSSIFSIDRIVVEGNTLMADDEVIELAGVSEGDNMFKASGHKVKKALKANTYISGVKISRKLPNIYTITLTERLPVMAISFEGGYVILDADGYAVDYADSTMHASLVTGLTIKSYTLGKVPEIEDSAGFKEISNLINKVNESGLFFKKVEYGSSLTVKCYITDTLLCSGTSSDIIQQVEQLKAVLYDLDQKEVRRGMVNIGSDGYISFSPITE